MYCEALVSLVRLELKYESSWVSSLDSKFNHLDSASIKAVTYSPEIFLPAYFYSVTDKEDP